MANTYELIASHTTASGGEANFTFSSIPNTFTDLLLRVSARSGNAGANANFEITFNGVTTGYYEKALLGNGSAVSNQKDSNSASLANQYISTDIMTANTFGSVDVYIPNYAGSTSKSLSIDFAAESNASGVNFMGISAGLQTATTAISSLKVSAGASLMQYSTFYLYGIKNS